MAISLNVLIKSGKHQQRLKLPVAREPVHVEITQTILCGTVKQENQMTLTKIIKPG